LKADKEAAAKAGGDAQVNPADEKAADAKPD